MTAFGSNDKPMLVSHVKEMASDRVAGRRLVALDGTALRPATLHSKILRRTYLLCVLAHRLTAIAWLQGDEGRNGQLSHVPSA